MSLSNERSLDIWLVEENVKKWGIPFGKTSFFAGEYFSGILNDPKIHLRKSHVISRKL